MIKLPSRWSNLSYGPRPDDIASSLRLTLLFVLGFSLLGLVSTLQAQGEGWVVLLRNSLLLAAASGAALVLLRLRKVTAAIYTALIANAAVLAYSAWLGAGVKGVTFAAFILPVLATALFLGRRPGYLAAGIATLIGLVLFVAGRQGWLVNIDRPVTDVVAWLANVIFFFVAAHQIGVSLAQVDRGLARAQQEIQERTLAEAEVRRLNAELEKRIAERTAQLAASEERYRLISAVSSDFAFSAKVQAGGAVVWDWVAGAFEAMTGFRPAEFETRGGWRGLVHPDDRPIDDGNFRALRNNERAVSELRIVARGGATRWVRFYSLPVWDAGQQTLTGIYGAVQDVTDRHQAETALREAELRYRTLVEQTSVVIYRDAPEPGAPAEYVSPQIETLLGYTAAEFTSHSLFWQTLLHPDDRARVLDAVERNISQQDRAVTEYRLRHRAGHWVWVRDESIVVAGVDGGPRYVQGVLSNVTERRKTEEALRASEQRFRALVEQLPAITYISGVGQLGETNYVSPQLESSLGYKPEEWMAGGLDFWRRHTQPEDYVRAVTEFERCFSKGLPYNCEYRVLARDGRTVWLQDRALRLNDQQGRPETILGVIVDITGRKQSEMALTYERNLLQALMDNIPDTIYFKDTASRFTRVNRAQAGLLGLGGPDEAVGRTDLDFQPPEVAQVFFTEEQELLRTGAPIVDREEYNPGPDGQPRWLAATKVPLRDNAGGIIGLVGISRDITRWKQNEGREKDRRALLERVVELGKTVTAVTDFDQCLRQIHQSIQKGLGFDRVGLFLYEAGARRFQGAYGTNAAGELEDTRWYSGSVNDWDAWQMALSSPTGLNVIDDYAGTQPLPGDTDMRGVKQHATLSAWAGGTPVALIAADNVISQRRMTREQLEALQLFAGYAGLAIQNARWNAELEARVARRTADLTAANRELESLSYTIGHDLRSPIRAIVGYSRILQDEAAGQLAPEQDRKLEQVHQAALRMGNMVDEFLTFLRLGQAGLHLQPVAVRPLVEGVIRALAPQTAGREVEITVGSLPDCTADAERLKDVFVELIGNAIKFSRARQPAQIEVGAVDRGGQICYYVRDNGAGFDMQYADKLFGVFQRLHPVDEFDGSGVGLAITQRIIQRHGGRIWAEAEPDRGATFYFNLG
jgi:PAS domain S-box-containing protein